MTIEPMATTVAGDDPDRAGKEHTGKHTRNRQTARKMPDNGDGKPDDPFGHTAGRHERRRKDEERNGKQRVMPRHGLKQRLRDRGQ